MPSSLPDRPIPEVPEVPDAPEAPVAPGTAASEVAVPPGSQPQPQPRRTKTGGLAAPEAPASAPAKPAALPKTVDKLAKLGLKTDIDLVLHLPMRYEDETTIVPVAELIPGDNAQAEGVIVDNEIAFRPRRQLLVKL